MATSARPGLDQLAADDCAGMSLPTRKTIVQLKKTQDSDAELQPCPVPVRQHRMYFHPPADIPTSGSSLRGKVRIFINLPSAKFEFNNCTETPAGTGTGQVQCRRTVRETTFQDAEIIKSASPIPICSDPACATVAAEWIAGNSTTPHRALSSAQWQCRQHVLQTNGTKDS